MSGVASGGATVRRVHAPLAWLPDGWAFDVTVEIDARGFFTNVRVGSDDPAAASPRADAVAASAADAVSDFGTEPAGGVMLPGMVNAHSHAFQRAMLGLTHAAGPGSDNFWSWRTLMYQLALRLTPEQVEAIALWVYTEMLRGGYTHVCEFHYLHNAPNGKPYADAAELSRAVMRAARRAGIGITLLPVLYMTSGFGGLAPRTEQRRFLSTPSRLLDIVRTLSGEHAGDPMIALGLAPHSLRAVPPAGLAEAIDGLAAFDIDAPIHIHIAEQIGEVDACRTWSGLRPVEWLLQHQPVDARWNLVHATHITADEATRVAASGASIVLCPTTEADLGDGIFPYRAYASRRGRYAVGSDSQVSRDWQSELRTLEYSQRLGLRERNVAATADRSAGEAMFHAALEGGAAASGLPLSRIQRGARADWVIVREDKLAFAARGPERYLDSLIFDHHAADFADIVVAGQSRRRSLEGDAYHDARNGFIDALRAT